MEVYDSCLNETEKVLLDDEGGEADEDEGEEKIVTSEQEETAENEEEHSSSHDDKKKPSATASNGERKKGGTSVKDKEPHMVQRRNARERRRVQLVNDGFTRLRRKIPTEPRNKKLSKVKTLQCAINYILHLQETLEEADKMQRAAGLMDFSPVGLGGGMATMNVPPYDGMHHMNAQQGHEGLTAVPMQATNCYNEWSYYENPPMCNPYEYQDVRGNYYY